MRLFYFGCHQLGNHLDFYVYVCVYSLLPEHLLLPCSVPCTRVLGTSRRCDALAAELRFFHKILTRPRASAQLFTRV